MGKENDVLALTGRTSSEKNALRPLPSSVSAENLPRSSLEAAEKLPESDVAASLAAEAAPAPSEADEIWCALTP